MAVNQAPAKQELKLPANGEERLFSLAIQSVKISSSTVEELKQSLRYAMVKIGLRSQNFPNEEEKAILLQHISQNYSNHTVDEIRLAFDMAIEGKLELLDGESVTCYENFSCLYFSSIMNAYRRWSAQVYKQLDHPERPIESQEEITEESMQEWIKETKKLRISVELLPTVMYDWLDKHGKISATPAEKHEYLQRAIAYRHGKLSKAFTESMTSTNRDALHAFSTMKDKGEFEGAEVGILKSLAKKMILFDYLNEQE